MIKSGSEDVDYAESMRGAFEVSATKLGYSLEKDDVERYIDNWLESAWQVFSLVDFSSINQ